MLILLYHILPRMLMPIVEAWTSAFIELIVFTILVGICVKIVLSLIGVQIFGRMSGIIAKAIGDSLLYAFKKLIDAIGWLIKMAYKACPYVYKRSKDFFLQKGLQKQASALAVLTVIICVIIFI